MNKKPEQKDEDDTAQDDQDSLNVYVNVPDHEALVNENREAIFNANEAQIAKKLKNSQPNTKGGDHLGKGLAPDTHKHEAIHEGADKGGKDYGEDGGDKIRESYQKQKNPGHKGSQDIKGSVGKIGYAADSKGQVEPNGDQDQNDAVDHSINERPEKHGSDSLVVRYTLTSSLSKKTVFNSAFVLRHAQGERVGK
jgi:hypothetical protein